MGDLWSAALQDPEGHHPRGIGVPWVMDGMARRLACRVLSVIAGVRPQSEGKGCPWPVARGLAVSRAVFRPLRGLTVGDWLARVLRDGISPGQNEWAARDLNPEPAD
jgi:hypothetical protein